MSFYFYRCVAEYIKYRSKFVASVPEVEEPVKYRPNDVKICFFVYELSAHVPA